MHMCCVCSIYTYTQSSRPTRCYVPRSATVLLLSHAFFYDICSHPIHGPKTSTLYRRQQRYRDSVARTPFTRTPLEVKALLQSHRYNNEVLTHIPPKQLSYFLNALVIEHLADKEIVRVRGY